MVSIAHPGFTGLVFIVLGLLSIAFPVLSTFSADLVIGVLFLVGGIAEIVRLFHVRGTSGFIWTALIALLFLAAGAFILVRPLGGAVTLTFILAIVFIIQGVSMCAVAFSRRSHGRWIWALLSGLVTGVIGVLILEAWPISSLWALGVLVGINLLQFGLYLITAGKDFHGHRRVVL